MITKNKLQSIISKYYLGGQVESVKWVVEEGVLTIDFMAPTKDMIGRLTARGFPLTTNGTLAIFNTTQLNRLLNVLSGDLMVDVEKTKAVLTKFNIQDAKSTINYSLADPLMIQKVGEVDEDVNWQVKATLDSEDFQTFVRAASSIQGNELVTLTPLSPPKFSNVIIPPTTNHNTNNSTVIFPPMTNFASSSTLPTPTILSNYNTSNHNTPTLQ